MLVSLFLSSLFKNYSLRNDDTTGDFVNKRCLRYGSRWSKNINTMTTTTYIN